MGQGWVTSQWGGGDMKDLGSPISILVSCPTDGVQKEKVKAANLSDIVPNTESETKVSIQGEIRGRDTRGDELGGGGTLLA